MTNACDAFDVGTILPGPTVIVKVENGRVYVAGLSIGGVPIEVSFECAQFYEGFYSLLDLLGIPHD